MGQQSLRRILSPNAVFGLIYRCDRVMNQIDKSLNVINKKWAMSFQKQFYIHPIAFSNVPFFIHTTTQNPSDCRE
jgi:hypothetical protein